MNRTPEELMRPEYSEVALRRVTGTGRLVAKVPTDFGDLNVAAQAAESSDAQMRSNSLSDVMVMMVDDDPMMTDVIQTYLEEAGYRRFVSVNDPLQALEAGEIQAEHYENFLKLRKESEFYELSYAERRNRDKDFGRLIKSVKKDLGLD